MSLSKKLILSSILSILVSIIIISLISNYMINDRFDIYLLEEQETRFNQINYELNNIYSQNDYRLYQHEIDSYASLEDIDIEVRDLNNNILYSSSKDSHMKGMHGHMDKMHRRKMGGSKKTNGNYTESSFPLYEGQEIVANIVIGYIDNFYLTESALVFKETLGKSFIISSVLAIFFGAIISIYLSKSLTNPLVSIRNVAAKIQKGDLSARSNIKTNTSEIVDLSDSINYLSETLSRQEDIRKKYASDISHELRTPITTLKTHIEAIIDGVWEADPGHLNILILEIDRLAALVDNLKNSFTSEEYMLNLNRSRFDLSKEMHNIVTSFIPIYNKENYSLNFTIEDDIQVCMDKDKLKQVVYNLLSNSIKYLNHDGRVFLELRRNNNNAIIRVIDNGIGIKKKDLDHVFDRFYRSDSSRNRDTGGTGLGLSIVKTIIDAHSGNITLDSIYGKGTRVTVVLPLEI